LPQPFQRDLRRRSHACSWGNRPDHIDHRRCWLPSARRPNRCCACGSRSSTIRSAAELMVSGKKPRAHVITAAKHTRHTQAAVGPTLGSTVAAPARPLNFARPRSMHRPPSRPRSSAGSHPRRARGATLAPRTSSAMRADGFRLHGQSRRWQFSTTQRLGRATGQAFVRMQWTHGGSGPATPLARVAIWRVAWRAEFRSSGQSDRVPTVARTWQMSLSLLPRRRRERSALSDKCHVEVQAALSVSSDSARRRQP